MRGPVQPRVKADGYGVHGVVRYRRSIEWWIICAAEAQGINVLRDTNDCKHGFVGQCQLPAEWAHAVPEQPSESLRNDRGVDLAWTKLATIDERDAHCLEEMRRGGKDGNRLHGIRPL